MDCFCHLYHISCYILKDASIVLNLISFASQILFLYLIMSQPESINHKKRWWFLTRLRMALSRWKSDWFKNAGKTRCIFDFFFFTHVLVLYVLLAVFENLQARQSLAVHDTWALGGYIVVLKEEISLKIFSCNKFSKIIKINYRVRTKRGFKMWIINLFKSI